MQWIARLIFRLAGWKTAGQVPPLNKFVGIAAPHTSAWDAVVALLAKYIFDIDFAFFGKKEAFDAPYGFILRALGGIPVDREHNHNMVDYAVKLFNEREHFILAMSPEGTRAYAPQWRTGFYHIARQAQVPIVLTYFDFKNKTVGIGPTFYPTGDMEKDIAEIKKFYRPIQGRHPEKGVR